MIMPYADDAGAMQIGDLQIENGTDRIAIFGSIDLTRDKPGLERARRLKDLLVAIVQTLETDRDLPDHVSPSEPPEVVDNPFR